MFDLPFFIAILYYYNWVKCANILFLLLYQLIFMQEEDAFWLLVTVVEKLLPSDYYTQSMVGTYVDQFVLAHIIKRHLPNIHK